VAGSVLVLALPATWTGPARGIVVAAVIVPISLSWISRLRRLGTEN